MEAYVDDMLVKSMIYEQNLRDLEEVFFVLKSYRIKPNPAKCVFAIIEGKILGFLINNKGI
jgi:hypothetical protein